MGSQTKRTKAIIDTTCYHFGITKEEFFTGRCYKCSDARKVAIAVLLETEACGSITEAANALNIERSTAFIALKALREYLLHNRRLRLKYEEIKNKADREKSNPKTLATG